MSTAKFNWYQRSSGAIQQDYKLDAMLIPVGKGVGLLASWLEKTASVAAKGSVEVIENVIKGFTKHGTNQAITREFKPVDILKIIREGTPVESIGRYGTQTKYTLGGNTVVVNAKGRVVSVFSGAPGSVKGLRKGYFIPLK